MHETQSTASRKNSGSEPMADGRGQSSRRAAFPLACVALVILILFYFGYRRVIEQQHKVESTAKAENGIPIVNVEQVRRASESVELTLPGNIAPITEAYVYARASGYVKQRYADLGDSVRQGELLVEIEAPELDQQVQQARAALAQAEQQLEQAKADLGEAQARQELARVTWDRYKVLVDHGAVSKQDGDQQFAVLKSTSATVAWIVARIRSAPQNIVASRANLERLVTLQEYEKVRAPFTGVITARNFDVGALISASGASMGQAGGTGSPATGAQGGELFRVAQIDRLRVLISVPETNAPGVKEGQSATIAAPALPNQQFPGKVTRTASAVDFSSRTMLTEVQVQNPDRALLPGMFVQVTLVNVRSSPPLLISGDSIMTSAKGLQVGLLNDISEPASTEALRYPTGAKQVHLRKIQVGRDFGTEIEVLSGLREADWIVKNPGDEIEEGAIVQPFAPPTSKSAPSRGPQTPAAGGVR